MVCVQTCPYKGFSLHGAGLSSLFLRERLDNLAMKLHGTRAEILWPIVRDVTFSSVISADMSETSLLQDTWETSSVLFCQGSDVCEILQKKKSLACKKHRSSVDGRKSRTCISLNGFEASWITKKNKPYQPTQYLNPKLWPDSEVNVLSTNPWPMKANLTMLRLHLLKP